ncbi:hypothetical protein AC249_AIPGENE5544 [Exaiptasia diaphana]|nr:hypothetical protein AC249_AIPGENE5544 [Exaiptasia diaphana]
MGLLNDHFLKQYYERPSRVGRFQKLFQKGSLPVYLKGNSDALVYRGAMGLTVIGLGVTFYGVYLMATNQMKKAK